MPSVNIRTKNGAIVTLSNYTFYGAYKPFNLDSANRYTLEAIIREMEHQRIECDDPDAIFLLAGRTKNAVTDGALNEINTAPVGTSGGGGTVNVDAPVSLTDTIVGATSASNTGIGTHTIDGHPVPSGNPMIEVSNVESWQQALPQKTTRQVLRVQNLSETYPLYVKIGASSNFIVILPLGSEVWEGTIIPKEAIYVSGPMAGEAFSASTDGT